MRALRSAFRFLLVRHRSLTISIVLFCTAAGLALGSGFWLMARLANVILIAIPIAYIWGKLNLRWLDVVAERPFDRLQEGNQFEERITVSNRSWFTKLWLEIEDLTDLPGASSRRVFSIGPRSQRTWRVVSEGTRRGLYTMGPVRVSTTDLFGLFRHSRTFGAPQSVLVYPRGVDLPNFYAPPANLPGEGRFRKPTHTITPNAASVREYLPGDSLNRIHWRSSARTSGLMVKLFELDPASDVWVVMDLQRDVQAGDGDDGTEEHAVRIAASIARYFLLANRSVGYLAYGKRLQIEEPERGLSQYTRILEHLALGRAEGDVSLAELVNHEGRRFGRHTTLIAITPSTDESWVASLQMLQGRGVKLAAVLLEPRTFGGDGSALLVYTALAAAGVMTYLVKRQDEIQRALSSVMAEGVQGGSSG
jgi:uncharacterized protein (DUF58 family)